MNLTKNFSSLAALIMKLYRLAKQINYTVSFDEHCLANLSR